VRNQRLSMIPILLVSLRALTRNVMNLALKNLSSKILAYSCALVLVWQPILVSNAHAQTSDLNLPRFGDASGDDLSPASERRLGRAIMNSLAAEGVVYFDPELTQWLRDLTTPLLQTRHAQGYTFDLCLIKDRSINAFALPGGYICVHTGLIEAAQSESEIASVLGHEIGHVTQRHIARNFSKQKQTLPIIVGSLLLAIAAAKANPTAALGVTQLGEAVARGQVLSFSRDAEREADRVGLEMMNEAGFSPHASVTFFQRLQAATRVYDNAAPEYLRSHPLTSERITDMQLRTLNMPAKIRPDPLEFSMVKARLMALGDGSRESATSALVYFEGPGAGRDSLEMAVALYGRAVAKTQLIETAQAEELLLQAQRAISGNPQSQKSLQLIAGQRIRNAQVAGQFDKAHEIAKAALASNPLHRPFILGFLNAQLQAGKIDEAERNVETLLQERRSDPELWRIASEIYAKGNKQAQAHRAAGEQAGIVASWRQAIDQMQAAQRIGSNDFIFNAIVDAKIKEFQAEFQREKNDPMFAKNR
jgi:predicted Zn-dependent protease